MTIPVEQVILLVVGILSDPGSSSKDHQKVVSRAIDIYKETVYQVDAENEKSKPKAPPAPTSKTPVTPPPTAAAKPVVSPPPHATPSK